ncbi:MAG: hypothetical protein HZB26_25560 [Candidatus Hydrogenedentes bacterium]|nr:hypothetical protein [Candidatus Hydrogenedentota bacterium]
MKILKSKLYALELEAKKEKLTKIKGEHKKIEWGSQIRSYVLHPYTLVKDHRTGYEDGNIQAVLDGKIDMTIGFQSISATWDGNVVAIKGKALVKQ